MAIKDVTAGFERNVSDNISEYLRTTKSAIDNIIGDFKKTGASEFWEDIGFVGMSAAEKTQLKVNLNGYCESIQNIIQGFEANAKLDEVIKGDVVSEAMHTYLQSIKDLLKAYVAIMKQEINEIDEAYNNFVEKTQGSIATDVGAMAKDISSKANDIIEASSHISLE